MKLMFYANSDLISDPIKTFIHFWVIFTNSLLSRYTIKVLFLQLSLHVLWSSIKYKQVATETKKVFSLYSWTLTDIALL